MHHREKFLPAMAAFDSLPPLMRAFISSYHWGFSDETLLRISALYRSGFYSQEQILKALTHHSGPPQKVLANAKAKSKDE